jgi:oligopeptide transport system ATP-binding protein
MTENNSKDKNSLIDLLKIDDLTVSYPTDKGELKAVNSVSCTVRYGEIMGIVGESGSGKSTMAYATMGLLKKPGHVTKGSISFEGRNVLEFNKQEMSHFRGSEVGMIFQDPMQCLDPSFTIGYQLVETLKIHEIGIKKADAVKKSIEMLSLVGINEPERMMHRYQHELSGGMRQRVMIAMSLLASPKLLIADEPTTALDVTIQDMIIQLLKKLCSEKGMAMMFITHNFGIVADICDRVTVMYGGYVMEEGSVDDVFYSAAHPYTKGLLNAIPKADLLSKEKLVPIGGTAIDPLSPPPGCVFSPRCPNCMDICKNVKPDKTVLSQGHSVSCWLHSGVQI